MKCPEHGAKYQTVKTTYEQQFGVILKDVEALRCPVDGEELFTMKQVEAIRQTLEVVLDKRTMRRIKTGKRQLCRKQHVAARGRKEIRRILST